MTARYRLVDAEVDGSIAKRLQEILEAEGREPPPAVPAVVRRELDCNYGEGFGG